jgi:hypothetical protein
VAENIKNICQQTAEINNNVQTAANSSKQLKILMTYKSWQTAEIDNNQHISADSWINNKCQQMAENTNNLQISANS